MKKNVNIVVLSIGFAFSLFLLALLVFHVHSYYSTSKSEFDRNLYLAFQESVLEDMEIRKQKLPGVFSFGFSPGAIVDSTIVVKENEFEMIKKDISNEKTKDKYGNAIQLILFEKNPIKVGVLDSLFCKALISRGINGLCTVLYKDQIRNVSHWSKDVNDIETYIPVIPEPLIVGVKEEILLQAYYKFSPLQIYARMPLSYWLAILGWLSLVAALIIAIPILQKRAKMQVTKQFADQLLELSLQHEETPRTDLVIEEEKMTPQVNKNLIMITDNLSFDTQNWKLYDQGKSIALAPQSSKALHCFLRAPKYFLSTKDIRLQVWGTEDMQDNTIRGCMSRLNRDLANIQGIKVVNLPREGYRLEIEYPVEKETTEDTTLLSLNE